MYLITGANGLLGSSICRFFLDKKVPFKALKRKNSDLSLLNDVKDKINWVEGDILDVFAIEEALEDIHTVIHSAAVVSFHDNDKNIIFKINVEGTTNLVNSCLKKGVPNFLHISSIAAIGRTKNSHIIDEETKWENSEYNSNYARSKYIAELEVWRGHMEGLKVIVVNPSVILGPGDFNKSSAKIFHFAYDEKPFYTAGSLNYVDVRDVTNIIWQLLEQNKFGERFILNAGQVTYKELLDKISENFNKKKPQFKVPPILINAAVKWEKFKSVFTGKRPLLTKETIQLSKKAFEYSNSKIVKTLDYKFIPLEESVKWTCQEFLKRINSQNLHH
jgi:dihydroflavonol-4-reductase